jgi:hypothetical protein
VLRRTLRNSHLEEVVVLILRAAVQHNAHALRTPKHGGFDVVKSSRRRFEGARGGVMGGGETNSFEPAASPPEAS